MDSAYARGALDAWVSRVSVVQYGAGEPAVARLAEWFDAGWQVFGLSHTNWPYATPFRSAPYDDILLFKSRRHPQFFRWLVTSSANAERLDSLTPDMVFSLLWREQPIADLEGSRKDMTAAKALAYFTDRRSRVAERFEPAKEHRYQGPYQIGYAEELAAYEVAIRAISRMVDDEAQG